MSLVTGCRQKAPIPSHFMSAIRLEKLLKSGNAGSLDKLIRHAQHLDELTGQLRAALPEELAAHLLSANLRESGELVLICSSSAWASRLRFESDLLLQVVGRSGRTAKCCKVTVSQLT